MHRLYLRNIVSHLVKFEKQPQTHASVFSNVGSGEDTGLSRHSFTSLLTSKVSAIPSLVPESSHVSSLKSTHPVSHKRGYFG